MESLKAKKIRIHDAVAENKIFKVKELLKVNKVDPNKGPDPPLCIAAQNGFHDILTVLLESGAELMRANMTGMYPIHLAARFGHLECLLRLLSSGADVNQQTKSTFSGDVPLYYAVANEHADIVDVLLSTGAQVDHQASALYSSNLPTHAAAQLDDPIILNLLLRANASINVQNGERKLPLHIAAYHGRDKNVERLISCGSEVDTFDSDDNTPLMLAVIEGHTEVVRQLCVAGASTRVHNKDGQGPVHIAALKGHNNIVKVLHRFGQSVNARDDSGRTPMHLAITRCQHKMKDQWQTNRDRTAINQEIEMLDVLIQAGADINAQDNHGDSVLHTCVKDGCSSTLEYIIKTGLKYTMVNKSGHTALTLACSENTHQAIRLLIQHCPGLLGPSLTYRRPLAILIQRKNLDCAKLLHDAGYHHTRDEATPTVDLNGKKMPDSIAKWLNNDLPQPGSLQKLCSVCVRNCLYDSLAFKVHTLPIPQDLRDQILLKRGPV